MSLATTGSLGLTTSKTVSDSVEHFLDMFKPPSAMLECPLLWGHHGSYSSSSYFICITHFQHKLYKVLHK